MADLVVLGVRKGGRWFYKTDPRFGVISLEPKVKKEHKVVSSFLANVLKSSKISDDFKSLLVQEVL